jgi:hypothetical protein
VPVVCLHPFTVLTQPFQRVLADGLQQREPRLAAACFRPDQAGVHQRAQRVHHLPSFLGLILVCGIGTDGFCR